jgi:hypothetical protein
VGADLSSLTSDILVDRGKEAGNVVIEDYALLRAISNKLSLGEYLGVLVCWSRPNLAPLLSIEQEVQASFLHQFGPWVTKITISQHSSVNC